MLRTSEKKQAVIYRHPRGKTGGGAAMTSEIIYRHPKGRFAVRRVTFPPDPPEPPARPRKKKKKARRRK